MHTSALTDTTTPLTPPLSQIAGIVKPIETSEEDEALRFLGSRSLSTAYLSGLIQDNGACNRLNRGTFYSFRTAEDGLQGVALIGHATLMKASNAATLEAFANVARANTSTHLLMCEQNQTERFWGFYKQGGQKMGRSSRQLHFELRWPVEVTRPLATPRLATQQDLDLLIPVHAAMALEESGVDPRVKDPTGFSKRYARRIEQGRTWVWIEGRQLQFKADLISETKETTYLEGIWVNPDLRRRGYGQGCMSQLAKLLLWRTKSLCVLINAENTQAINFFKQCGYHMRGVYDTIFLT